MRRDLPSGTVTFLFTDVEGSTKLLLELGTDVYADALARYRRILREAFGANGGVEVDTQGDAFFVAFPTAPGALRAAAAALNGLATGPIHLRIGIHTGTPQLADEGYVGIDVHRAARIAACGHGRQVLVSASTAALAGRDGLRDLGEHRLKDLSVPDRIYQLGNEDFPPLKSLYQTNLPIPTTSFLGREQELTHVLGLLSKEDVRLLTLTGPGGTGKTRLALQSAGAAADAFVDGVWWVPLASLGDADLVLETAGHVLGARDGLAAHIADKSMLLLFDNFEHVVEAATDLTALLTACPNLQILVTSRELLRIPGEQAYPVPPLEPQDGTELFLARARAALPSFVASAAVPELCARLENLPLALELAAARVRVLSPEQLVERISLRLDLLKGGRGVDPRQRTLRATIEWSYDLLRKEEQQLFARLAVFAGGWRLEAAEKVCEADLDTLQSLLDKSLLRHAEERFWMLETIREYASGRLEDSGEAKVMRLRHAEYFLALAEEAQPNLRGNPGGWLRRLECEHDNFRAALDWLESSSESQRVLLLAGALARFWYQKGHFTEGRRRLESALSADERPTAARARALNGAGQMAVTTGDPATARHRAEEALALHRSLGNAWGTAYSGLLLGLAADEEGDPQMAQQLFEESVRRFSELGDEHFSLLATDNLAYICTKLGNYGRARALHEEIVLRARAVKDERIEAMSLGGLAGIAVHEGRVPEALSMLKMSLPVWRDLGEPQMIARSLGQFADALALSGRAGTAARLLSYSLALYEEIGTREAWVTGFTEELLATIRSQLDSDALAEAWEQGRALTVDQAVALALDAVD